jgi:UDP-glucose 4-epimerase
MTTLMNILLTGGTGFIGSHAAVTLSQLGHQVILYDNLINSSHEIVTKVQQITGKPVHFIRGDVRDTELLTKTLSNHGRFSFCWFKGRWRIC